MEFNQAVDNLLVGIGDDYTRWSSPLKTDEQNMVDIKTRMIAEFLSLIHI